MVKYGQIVYYIFYDFNQNKKIYWKIKILKKKSLFW